MLRLLRNVMLNLPQKALRNANFHMLQLHWNKSQVYFMSCRKEVYVMSRWHHELTYSSRRTKKTARYLYCQTKANEENRLLLILFDQGGRKKLSSRRLMFKAPVQSAIHTQDVPTHYIAPSVWSDGEVRTSKSGSGALDEWFDAAIRRFRVTQRLNRTNRSDCTIGSNRSDWLVEHIGSDGSLGRAARRTA